MNQPYTSPIYLFPNSQSMSPSSLSFQYNV